MSSASAPEPLELERVRVLVDRFALVSTTRRNGAGAGTSAAAALQSGATAAAALEAAGLSPDIVRFVEVAAPTDLPATLEALAPAVALAARRRDLLRREAANATAIASAGTAAAVAAHVAASGFSGLGAAIAGDPSLASAVHFASGVAILGVALLVLLALALLDRLPLPMLAALGQQHRRALVLAGAAAAASSAKLTAALRGAAALSEDRALAADTVALADGLERGNIRGAGAVVLGAQGASLFAVAAGAGAGRVALRALAESERRRAEAAAPEVALRVQLLAVMLGGLVVLGAGLGLYLPYLALLAGVE